ncbi:MAG: VWA domain-containing protein, partial [Gammaproteobacteria bacterium]
CFERFFAFGPFTPRTVRKAYFQGDPEDLMAFASGARGMGLPRERVAWSDGDPPLGDLSRLLLARDFMQLSLRLAEAARVVGLDTMRALRDKSTFVLDILRALGVDEIDADIDHFSGVPGAEALVTALRQARAYLARQVREYVETQYLLHVDATGKRAIVEAAIEAHLSHVQPAYFDDVRKVVERLAEKLLAHHKRRRRRAHRGLLDTRHTLRRNLAYEGIPFDLRWRRIKVQKPKVFAICDVSGSVAR